MFNRYWMPYRAAARGGLIAAALLSLLAAHQGRAAVINNERPFLAVLQKAAADTRDANPKEQVRRTNQKAPFVQIPESKDSNRELTHKIEKQKLNVQLVKFTGDLAHYTKFLFAATGALFIATGGLVVIGFLQIWDAKKSIKAAEDGAKAAQASADVAKMALTQLEQPFLVFSVKETGLHVDLMGKVSPSGFLVSWLENIGRTPAVLIEHADSVCVAEREAGFPHPIDPKGPYSPRVRHTTFPTGIAVGSHLHYELREPMTAKPMEEDRWYKFADTYGRSARLFVYGFIRYADIFDGHYILGYCAIFDLPRNRFVLYGDSRYNYFHKENDDPNGSVAVSNA